MTSDPSIALEGERVRKLMQNGVSDLGFVIELREHSTQGDLLTLWPAGSKTQASSIPACCPALVGQPDLLDPVEQNTHSGLSLHQSAARAQDSDDIALDL